MNDPRKNTRDIFPPTGPELNALAAAPPGPGTRAELVVRSEDSGTFLARRVP